MSPLPPELASAEAHLAAYIVPRRWFREKSRQVSGAAITAAIPLGVPERQAWFAVVRVAFSDGGSADYALPLVSVDARGAAEARTSQPHLVVCDLDGGGALLDALGDPQILALLFAHVAAGVTCQDGDAGLRFRSYDERLGLARGNARLLGVEQSNTSVAFGEDYILKVIRKLDGTSPDLEMGSFLTRAGYTHAARVAGAIELVRGEGETTTAAILHRFVPNQGDAWAFFLERLAAPHENDDPLGEDRPLVRRLAARVAEMHVLLASRRDLLAFAPEQIDLGERARLADQVTASFALALDALTARRGSLTGDIARILDVIVANQDAVAARVDAFVSAPAPVWKTRLHGDLHLGQVLVTGDDFVIIDFEGEPARPLAERKAKRSPLADLAGLLRSFHYAAVAAARARPETDPARYQRWHRAAADEIVATYLREAGHAAFLAPAEEDTVRTLQFYLLEKCIYELHSELNNRPDWIAIPVAGLASLFEGPDGR